MAERAFPQPAEELALPSPSTQLELAEGVKKAEIADPITDLKNAKKRSEAIEIMKALVADNILRANEKGEYLPVDPKNTVAATAVRIFNVLKYRLKEEKAEHPLTRDAAKSRDAVRDVVKRAHPQTDKTNTSKPGHRNESKNKPKKVGFSPLYITLSNDKTYDTPSDFERFYNKLNGQNPTKAAELRSEYKAQLKDRITMIREESEKEAKHVATADTIKRKSDKERPGVREMVKIFLDMAWIKLNSHGQYEANLPVAQSLADAANKRIRELEQAQPKTTVVKHEFNNSKTSIPAARNESASNTQPEKPKSIKEKDTGKRAEGIETATTGINPNTETEKSRLETEKLSVAIHANPALKIITRALYAFADKKPEKIAPGMTLDQLETIIRKSVDLIDSDGNDEKGKKTPTGLRSLEALDVTPSSLERVARDLNKLIEEIQTSQRKAA